MKNKYEFINFRLSEKEVIEDHFNEMSKNGWNVKYMSNYIVVYEKSNFIKYYYLDYNTHPFSNPYFDSKEDEENQNQLYQDLGYEFECASNCAILYSSKEFINQLYTDEETCIIGQKAINNKFLLRYLGYNILHLFFIFMCIRISPIDFIFVNINNYLFLYIFSLILLIVTNLSSNKRKLKTIRIQTIFNILLIFIVMISPYILYFKIMDVFNNFHINALILVLSSLIYLQDLFLFKKKNGKHNNHLLRFFTFISLIVLIFGFVYPKQNELDNMLSKPFTHTIISNDYTDNYTVTRYKNDENDLLTRIECISENINDGSKSFNYFYYNDKKDVFKDLIWDDFTSVNDYNYVETVNDVEIYYDNKEYLAYTDDVTRCIFKKENEYIQIIIKGTLNKQEIYNLLNSINWKQ